MKNIATPVIKNQANGSFAENEINKHMIAFSYHEVQSTSQLQGNNIKAIESIYNESNQK